MTGLPNGAQSLQGSSVIGQPTAQSQSEAAAAAAAFHGLNGIQGAQGESLSVVCSPFVLLTN